MSIPTKRPKESIVETNHIVLPSHANNLGTVFGGTIMSWIDVAAAICAHRHSGHISVTASIDTLHFLSPVEVGDMVTLIAKIVHTGKSSMMVSVDVQAQNPQRNKNCRCVTAHLSFVALDEKRRPVRVPALQCDTAEEKRDFEEGARRRQNVLAQKPANDGAKPR